MFPVFRNVSPTRSLKVAVVAVLAGFSLTGPATLIAADRISVFTEQDYPLNYTELGEDDEEVLGFATELVVTVLEEAGLEYEIRMVPWVRAMTAIDSAENVLVYSMIRSAERENKYHWIGEIIRADFCLYGLRRNASSLPGSLEEALDFRIGVTRGYVQHNYLVELGFTRLIVANDSDQLIRMFRRGRIDLVVLGSNEVAPIRERYGFKENDLIGLAKLEWKLASLQMALSKRSSNAIVSRLQHAYQNVRTAGTYDRIMRPLISGREECRVDGQP